jgi:meso-butanediol dehydrogenase/(S,S)-butanediol dehydrogenase/diacetyl reductase
MDLRDKVALVTGAGRGLGRAIATALADAGCHVVVSDRGTTTDATLSYRLAGEDDLAATAAAVRSRGRRAFVQAADVTSPDDLAALVAAAERELGGLDVVVANAGIMAAGSVADMDPAVWDRLFAVNTRGVFLTARAAIPALRRRGGGRIVNVASVAGKTGRAGLAGYCASKAAVISLTQALAEELGPSNIAVNALCPGYIRTAMWDEVLIPTLAAMTGIPREQVFDRFIGRQTFLKREQTPEEIADGAVYLCRAENVTGTALTVAGGGEVH